MSLWVEATTDHEAERLDELTMVATVSTAGHQSFVLGASTADEFNDRVAVVASQVESAIERVTYGDPGMFPIVHQAVLADWERSFDVLTQQRRAQVHKANNRRGYERAVQAGRQVEAKPGQWYDINGVLQTGGDALTEVPVSQIRVGDHIINRSGWETVVTTSEASDTYKNTYGGDGWIIGYMEQSGELLSASRPTATMTLVRHGSLKTAAGTFDEWMAKVDAAVEAKVGLSAMDLPDCPFMDWYEDGVSPSSAASKCVRYAREGSLKTARSADWEKGYADGMKADWSTNPARNPDSPDGEWDPAYNGNSDYGDGFNAASDERDVVHRQRGNVTVGDGFVGYDDPDDFLRDFLSTKASRKLANDLADWPTADKTIDAIRDIVKNFSAKMVDGVMVDVQSANAIVTVYDALSDANKVKFMSLPIDQLGTAAWKLISKASSRTAAIQWRQDPAIPDYGWFVNPSGFDYAYWANIKEIDGKFNLAVIAATGGDYSGDTLVFQQDYPTLDAAKEGAEEWLRSGKRMDADEFRRLQSRGSKTAAVDGEIYSKTVGGIDFIWEYDSDSDEVSIGYAGGAADMDSAPVSEIGPDGDPEYAATALMRLWISDGMHNEAIDSGSYTASRKTAAIPTGRSDYKPGMARIGEPTPQSDPDMFSSEDLLAEIKYLLKMNERLGSNVLRTIAYSKLLGILQDRGFTGKKAYIDSGPADYDDGYGGGSRPMGEAMDPFEVDLYCPKDKTTVHATITNASQTVHCPVCGDRLSESPPTTAAWHSVNTETGDVGKQSYDSKEMADNQGFGDGYVTEYLPDAKTGSWHKQGALRVARYGQAVVEVAEIEGQVHWGAYLGDTVLGEGTANTLGEGRRFAVTAAKTAATGDTYPCTRCGTPTVQNDGKWGGLVICPSCNAKMDAEDAASAEWNKAFNQWRKDNPNAQDDRGFLDANPAPKRFASLRHLRTAGENPFAKKDESDKPKEEADPKDAPAKDAAPADKAAPADPVQPDAAVPGANPAAPADQPPVADVPAAAPNDAAQIAPQTGEEAKTLDPTTMDVGMASQMSFTMADGGAGQIEVSFIREENGVYYFNGPTGEFGVGQQNGQWQDAEGNTFTFGAVNTVADQGLTGAPGQDPTQTPPDANAAPADPAAAAAPKKDAEAPAAPADDKAPAKDPPADDKPDEKKENPFAKKSGSMPPFADRQVRTAASSLAEIRRLVEQAGSRTYKMDRPGMSEWWAKVMAKASNTAIDHLWESYADAVHSSGEGDSSDRALAEAVAMHLGETSDVPFPRDTMAENKQRSEYLQRMYSGPEEPWERDIKHRFCDRCNVITTLHPGGPERDSRGQACDRPFSAMTQSNTYSMRETETALRGTAGRNA